MAISRPKLELKPGEEARVVLLKDKPATGENSYGAFHMYNLAAEHQSELAFFAPAEIHQFIQERKLGKGSHMILRRSLPKNREKPRLEIAVVEEPLAAADDGLKAILLQSLLDAVEVVRQAEIQFSNDEIQKLATTLFIQRMWVQ